MPGIEAPVRLAQPSAAFLSAILEAYEALSRKGISPITPDRLWERMQTAAWAEGTLADLLAWDGSPGKGAKSYAGLIERLIEQGRCSYLQMVAAPGGLRQVGEEIPF